MGARLVRLVSRALFWYTPTLSQLHYAGVRMHEAQSKALEGLRARIEELDKEVGRLRETLRMQTGAVTPGTEPARQIEEFYLRLQDEFRGYGEVIERRLSVYAPIIEKSFAGPDPSVLDIGCGRGEWLELLRKRGWDALGIDCNRGAVQLCEAKGLRVIEGDALAYLKTLPDNCLDVVTGFHIIEHLPFAAVLEIFAQTFRVLKPNGVGIFETPNPNNLSVGAKYFYLDPTHRNPIPPELGRLIALTQRFERVDILEVNPWPESHRVKSSPDDNSEVAGRFNELFYGSQDYGIVAWKSGAARSAAVGKPCAS